VSPSPDAALATGGSANETRPRARPLPEVVAARRAAQQDELTSLLLEKAWCERLLETYAGLAGVPEAVEAPPLTWPRSQWDWQAQRHRWLEAYRAWCEHAASWHRQRLAWWEHQAQEALRSLESRPEEAR
jgi:hypothetical protein